MTTVKTPQPMESSPEVEQWWSSKGRMDSEEPCTPEEATAMRDFLVVHSGRRSLTVHQAALELMNVPEGRDDLGDPSSKALRIAYLLLDVQLDFEALQPLTLDLLDAIDDLTEPGEAHESALRDPYSMSWESCADLPEKWNELVSNQWRSCRAYKYQPLEDETEDDSIRKWTAMNALFALRCQRWFETTSATRGWESISQIGLGDLGTIGLIQICETLEQEPWKRRPEKLLGGAHPSGWKKYELRSLDIELPSAARWLRLCGRYLFRRIKLNLENSQASEQFPAIESSTDLWKVDDDQHLPGISEARWHFWKQRLLWIANDLSDTDVRQSTKEDAQRTADLMKSYEQS